MIFDGIHALQEFHQKLNLAFTFSFGTSFFWGFARKKLFHFVSPGVIQREIGSVIND